MSAAVENIDNLLAEVESAISGEEAASPKSQASKYAVTRGRLDADGGGGGTAEVEMTGMGNMPATTTPGAGAGPRRSASRRNSAFSLPDDFHPQDAAHDTPAARAHSAFVGDTASMHNLDSDSDAESDAGGEEKGCDRCLMRYHLQARRVRVLTRNPFFDDFIIMVILVAGILVGVQTYPLSPDTEGTLEVVDAVILTIFTAEVVLKITAEGRRPWIYFVDNWNKFDFFIVVAAFTPGISSQATMLRLLRLLRVLKLVKALPQLQIIVTSLLSSFSSLGYIAMLMTMLFYLFAILAVMLFGKNDPHHFGTLHIAFLSLWRSATGEDWTDLMYLGMYGCDPPMEGGVATGGGFYDDDLFRHMCTESAGMYATAAAYHIVFHIFAGLVLLNLMVGVIIGSIFEAKAGLNGDKLVITVQRAKDLPKADLIGSRWVIVVSSLWSFRCLVLSCFERLCQFGVL
jgi:voltage-gated sodium channel